MVKEESEEGQQTQASGPLRRRITRREALSTGATAGVIVGAAVVAGVGGYFAGGAALGGPRTATQTVTQTAGPTTLYAPSAEVRAINAINQLKAEGKFESLRLNIMTPAGASSCWDWSFKIFEELTGVRVENFEVPYGESFAKIIPEAAAKTGSWDITCAPPGEALGDFGDANLTTPLDDFMARYDPQYEPVGIGPEAPTSASASYSNCPVHPLTFSVGLYLSKMHTWVADGDVWQMYVRQDLLDRPDLQNRYQESRGKLWNHPSQWDWKELNDVVAFMDGQNLTTGPSRTRGAWLYRERRYSQFDWMSHYYERSGKLFDDNMNPTVNNPAAIEGLEEQQEITQYMNDIVFSGDFTEQYTHFPGGEAFLALAWPSLGKYSRSALESVGAGVTTHLYPSHIAANGERISITGYYGGVISFINNYSRNKELAYLYLQWITGPTNSAVNVSQPGWFDPFRICHFTFPKVEGIYASGPYRENYDRAVPPLTIPKAFEFLEPMRINFNRFYLGEQSAEDALRNVEDGWRGITNRLESDGKKGILQQQWNLQKPHYPEVYRQLVGW